MSIDVSTLTVRDLFNRLRKSGLLQEHEILAWQARRSLPDDPLMIIRIMVRERALTIFQSEHIVQGSEFNFVIGSYRIQDHLGVGSKGTLYLAEHRAMQRQVALKVLHQDKAESRLTLERFYREGRVTASLNHPNIVKLYDFTEEADLPCLMMEYVEGQTLAQIMNASGPLHYEKAIGYVCQAAAGLKHAHSKGVIHRDIKPSNLMLDKYGVIKILDMGHSRFTDGEEMNITKMYDPKSVVGTVDFVAPEQALGEQVDSRCDIYSLGATLFTLIAGRPPFVGNAYQMLMAHQVQDPPLVTQFSDTCPPVLNTIISKMMAKNPAARYQTADEVIQALAPWQEMQHTQCPATIPTASVRTKSMPVLTLEVAPERPKSRVAAVVKPASVVMSIAKSARRKAKTPAPRMSHSGLLAGCVLAALAAAVIVYKLL
ncbi:MAG TPA: serine/threonine-protein kinase [Gemmatales bacterium]|nr:serine/threonine-protein kinase [Gemmatales bacterium]